jgi:protein SCO1/2
MATERTLAIVIATVALATVDPGNARADDLGNEIAAPDPSYKANDVVVDEHLGAHIPLDAAFRTADGVPTTLGELLQGELPTILTFNYSDCPMLCSLQLNGLVNVLPAIATPSTIATATGTGSDGRQLALRIGQQFRIVTIDLEPNEPLAKLARMRDRYLERAFPGTGTGTGTDAQRASARSGWTFLAAATPGDDAAIRRVANAVGFKYTYIKERAEWAHPAALILLSSTGAVTRYVYGIEFEPAAMRESIVKAGQAEAATAIGFMNRCYHFDPGANSHARAGVLALRVGAAGFVVLLISGFGVMRFLKKQRRAHGEPS